MNKKNSKQANGNESKKHHYVPQFYLKLFARDDQIFVNDKIDNRQYFSNVMNVGMQNHFNYYKRSDNPLKFEQEMASKEGVFSQCLAQCHTACFLSDKSVYLSEFVKKGLADFAVYQMARTPTFRKIVEKARNATLEDLKPIFNDERLRPEDIKFLEQKQEEFFGNEQDLHITFMSENLKVNKMADVLYQHCWYFGVAVEKRRLIISDNPVSPVNAIMPELPAGIASPGVRICVPISRDICWFIVDKSLVNKNSPPSMSKISMTDEYIDKINDYQIKMSDRFIYGQP